MLNDPVSSGISKNVARIEANPSLTFLLSYLCPCNHLGLSCCHLTDTKETGLNYSDSLVDSRPEMAQNDHQLSSVTLLPQPGNVDGSGSIKIINLNHLRSTRQRRP